MRVAIISDIHGNAVALESVLRDLAREVIDCTVCLGDVASGGPQPGEVIARLRASACPVVMGNMDAWCLDPQPGQGKSKNARRGGEVRSWGIRQLSTDDLAFLQSFRHVVDVSLEAVHLLCCHGSPRSNEQSMAAGTADDGLAEMLSGSRATVVAAGHTHTQMLRYYGDTTLLNPGSVGAPIPASERRRRVGQQPSEPRPDHVWAEYGLVCSERGGLRVELRRAPVDSAELVRAARASGMPHADWWLAQRYGDATGAHSV
jgi:putative phosphoesterase